MIREKMDINTVQFGVVPGTGTTDAVLFIV